ncbi:S-receptor-like serine/threonine-protein kinase [Parasponia andersonii]|uniref:Receptor-like serine/threonine-protein kinase n=1 Tax=Parasponia andersonii TaxID=3476 RepID=A0A2P5B7G0_PARAD|nr:S-receptor-like serine/threonine-protein kinase [Parasponia andersonii]
MATSFLFYVLYFAITSQLSSSNSDTLRAGSSLSVEKPNVDVLTSPNGVFSAGFHTVGINAYCFSVWFNDSPSQENRTIVWMANRDQPVNGKGSKLSLLKANNLILTDSTSRSVVWSSTITTTSRSVAELRLNNSGNVVLLTSDGFVLWESFDSPTDTLLPGQQLTRYTELVSSRSQGNSSSGFHKLLFDTDNVLRLVYDGIQLTSVYWPPPWLVSWEAGRSTYNNTKIAVLDSLGNFSSSDDFTFMSADYGARNQRRLRIDYDGNLRLYTRRSSSEKWGVSWQAFTDTCKIHGVCGPNSICSFSDSGRQCSCIPGYKMKNHTDWSYGCEPEFKLSCDGNGSDFLKLPNTEFYGYDLGYYPNYTFRQCRDLCMQLCKLCVGFQYSFFKKKDVLGYHCYPKLLLVNGYRAPMFFGDFYLRYQRNYSISYAFDSELSCLENATLLLPRFYSKSHDNELVKFILWFVTGLGGFEMICVLLVWLFLLARSSQQNSGSDHTRDYLLAATGFKRFSFSELKKATRGFSEEIGRGAAGIVYKGVLLDSRVAAIKRLTEAHQGEAEFLAEVNTIGRLNHMHLIEMWGYCVEGKHRLLVYEYMENGSLADDLRRNSSYDVVLDWEKRFAIALGTSKGLAYLHEECLEWVLHCDVKPQNILLDSKYNPKVADFGLSKLLKRGEAHNSSFSKIRGTRGYMAPEWVYNLPITSKVDVYSYGIVVLEMVTGRKPMFLGGGGGGGGGGLSVEQERLVTWVREKMNSAAIEKTESWIEEIADPKMAVAEMFDKVKMELLVKVALQCVEEEKEARPTMRQVVQMLQCHEDERTLLFN